MKKRDIKDLNKTELLKKLDELRSDLQAFRFSTTSSKSKDTKTGRDLRRNIARILTKLNK